MQNVSWEYVSIIIYSERKSDSQEKLVTETFSAFYINISAFFIFLKLLSCIYSDEY
jgi:hypothetical protein